MSQETLWTESPVERASPQALEKRLPLSGVRVLDFCWVVAGPLMTAMLADLGAQVIKVESKLRMDGSRIGRPIVGDEKAGDEGDWPELQPLFHSMNRNKLDITLNLQAPEGVELAKRLAGISHAVTDNFSAGTLKRLGLGYEALREVNPSIVVLSMSGTGQDGPMSNALTYAPIVVAMSGLGSLLGYREEPPLAYLKGTYGDSNASMYSVMGLMAALLRARRTGVGEFLDVSQWETASCGLDLQFLETVKPGSVATKGNDHPWQAPHGNYRCAGEDEWIAVSCETDEQWRRLCGVLGIEGEARFEHAGERLQWRRELDELVGGKTVERERFELSEALQAAGVAAAPVMNIRDQFQSEHFQARGIHVEANHPKLGYELLQGLPWRTASHGRGKIRRAAPLFGQDNAYVFGELLGLTPEEIAEYEAKQVIY